MHAPEFQRFSPARQNAPTQTLREVVLQLLNVDERLVQLTRALPPTVHQSLRSSPKRRQRETPHALQKQCVRRSRWQRRRLRTSRQISSRLAFATDYTDPCCP